MLVRLKGRQVRLKVAGEVRLEVRLGRRLAGGEGRESGGEAGGEAGEAGGEVGGDAGEAEGEAGEAEGGW